MTALLYRFCLLLFALTCTAAVRAQLCAGSLGDPVVHITFGAGANPGAQLPTTSYSYIQQDCPSDGQYTIRNSTDACFGNTWHRLSSDHTGDPNGYFMQVNASFQPGDFYLGRVGGLCGNTTYEFAAWVLNMLRSSRFCPGGSGIKPNLTFSIETTGGSVLATYNSGDIDGSDAPQWKQYGMFFTTPANTSEVVVRIRNNAPGGCGNDLALDDITFRPCGARIDARIEGLPGNSVSLCAGTAATYRFAASFSGNYVNPEVQWQESTDEGVTWVNLPGAVSNNYTWQGRPAGNYRYRMLVAEQGNINSIACRVASQPLSINVQALPRIQINEVGLTCPGQQLSLAASIDYADSARGTYQWTLPAGIQYDFSIRDSGTMRTLRGSQPATSAHSGAYRLAARSAAGCENVAVRNIVIASKPAVRVEVPALLCTGGTYTFRSIATDTTAISNWFWLANASAVGTASDITLRTGQAGPLNLRLAVRATNGCLSDTLTVATTVQPTPVASFVLPEVCLADPFAQFQSTATVAGGGTLTYRWTFGDPANPALVSTQKDPRYQYGRTGVYPVRQTVTSAAGCVADSMQLFTVNGSSPRAAFTLVNTGLVCGADTVRLRNTATVDFGNITRLEIRWKNDNDPAAITIDETPAADKVYAFSYRAFTAAGTNRFVVRFAAYSGIGCVSETTREIVVQQSPEVQLGPLPSLCANDSGFLLAQGSEQTGLPGSGVYSGAGVGSNGRFTPALAGAGAHTLQYRFTTPAGCSAVATQTVRVFAVPRVSAGPDKRVIAGGSIQLEGTATGGDLRLSWNPTTFLSDATAAQPRVTPQADMNYLFTALSAEGCKASDEVVVTVMPDLFIPNAFTPDGDGINDTWVVPYLESLTNARVQVFNRYGQVVFESRGGQRWDGRFKGTPLPAGGYVYQVQFGNQLRKGMVMLIR